VLLFLAYVNIYYENNRENKMTNKMIDADALLRWIKATKGLFDDETLDDFYLSTLNKINELATPAKPQESIFDANGWCWDFNKFKDYYSEYGFLIKTDQSYTTIKCGEQYRLCLKGVIAWQPLPKLSSRDNK
jgi:hypothetical protein